MASVNALEKPLGGTGHEARRGDLGNAPDHSPAESGQVVAGCFAGSHADRRIEGAGTPESAWQADATLKTLPTITLGSLLPADGRLVVLAPHPDDEVLGCGGLLSMALRQPSGGARVLVLGVTDGEASHPGSSRWIPAGLVEQRGCERVRGLAVLGTGAELRLLRLRDGHVADDEATLVQRLGSLLTPTDVLVTTWRHDGHPDHEACGRAGATLARGTGCTLWEMPVWMWHWAAPGDARVPWQDLLCLPLDELAGKRKRKAIQSHRSQLDPDGERPPVLAATTLDRLMRPSEYFFRGATA